MTLARRLSVVLSAASFALALAGLPATAATQPCYRCGVHPTAAGGNGVITVQHGTSDPVPGRGSPTQGRGNGRHDYFYIEEYDTPTCMGNGLSGTDSLCGAAVRTCPVGEIRFWIWHRRVDVKVGNPDVQTLGPWKQEQGSFCLGPDDPGVPSIVKTLATAHNVFEQKVTQLAPPAVKTRPGPRTLVNYLTTFTASNATPFTFDVTVAGATVHLSVRPISFRWSFGDGTSAETTAPTVTHTYLKKGQRRLAVDVTWGGTFSVGAAPELYTIDPPATVAGVPSVLTVVEARAENVA